MLIVRVDISFLERSYLDFIMLEPDRFLQMGSFEFDVVETERFIDVWMGDGIYRSDCSFKTPERAIANYTYTTTRWKYLVAHLERDAPVPSPLRESRD